MASSLYEADFYAWTRDQSEKLRALFVDRANLPLDFENLAEEIESVGRRDRRQLHSRMARIIERLLKLGEWTLPEPRNGWENSGREERDSLDLLFEQSPSLRPVAGEELTPAFRRAARHVEQKLVELCIDPLPRDCPYTLDQVLSETWWPEPRDR